MEWDRRTKKAFDSIDKDKDGFIDVEELRNELSDSCAEFVEEILKEADKDGDGKVDYEEFSQLLRSQSKGKRGDHSRKRGK